MEVGGTSHFYLTLRSLLPSSSLSLFSPHAIAHFIIQAPELERVINESKMNGANPR